MPCHLPSSRRCKQGRQFQQHERFQGRNAHDLRHPVRMELACVSSSYHNSRLPFDRKRRLVWTSLWRYYFRHIVPPDGCVLDLGCGYGDFINCVEARRRIALDVWDDFPAYLDEGIEPLITAITDLSGV